MLNAVRRSCLILNKPFAWAGWLDYLILGLDIAAIVLVLVYLNIL